MTGPESAPPAPKAASLDPAFGLARLFPEWVITVASALGGPISGLILVHKNFLELREFDKARRALFIGSLAVLAYYAILIWLGFRFNGYAFPAYAKLLLPLLLKLAFVFFQKERLREFLNGGAQVKPAISSLKYVLYGLVFEAALIGAGSRLLPEMRGPKVTIGLEHHELYYEGMDAKEAGDLAFILASEGHLQGPVRIHLKAAPWKTGYRLFFPLPRKSARDLEAIAFYSALIHDLQARTGKSSRGCFADDPYALRDTLCFGQAGTPLLLPIWNNNLHDSKAVLEKVKAETDFFLALFEEAVALEKRTVTWERIPTLYGFAGNGVGTANYENISDALAASYGNRERAELAIRILINCFRKVRVQEDPNVFKLYLGILRQVRANLDSMDDTEASPLRD